jgi:hypothetical protein
MSYQDEVQKARERQYRAAEKRRKEMRRRAKEQIKRARALKRQRGEKGRESMRTHGHAPGEEKGPL